MTTTSRVQIVRPAAAAIVCLTAACTVVTALWACGPFLTDLLTVTSREPADAAAYDRGNVGIVRPAFARRHLVQAYRRYSDLPPLSTSTTVATSAAPATAPPSLADQWQAAADPGGQAHIEPSRSVGDYQWIDNCLDDAFRSAMATLKERAARFGGASEVVRDWTRAQTAVFANCGGTDLVLPEPAAASADAGVRADRAYQTAAAYFYATRYDEAEQRFRAIAADRSSPWRKYGRYLAARAVIRRATIAAGEKTGRPQGLAAAEADLRAVLADPEAASLHPSARGLLDLIATRIRPLSRLTALSHMLATADTVADQEIADFRYLIDRYGDETVDAGSPPLEPGTAPVRDDDMLDWIVTIQRSDAASVAHALAQWKKAHAMPWLIALLWTMPPAHGDAAAVLAEAAAVRPGSPAFDTVAFARVRLLVAQDRRADARAALATLPTEATPDTLPETINLFKAERFQLARTLDDLLANAPRAIIRDGGEPESYATRSKARSAKAARGAPSFDEDAAIVFTARLPLDRLVAASRSRLLPDRLRARVAIAAFTRAVLFGRDDAAMAVAPQLRALSPQLAGDLDRYIAATTAVDRHRAALLLLLRAPGMHPYVRGIDDEWSYEGREPSTSFEHTLRRNWWCGIDEHGWEPFTAPPSEASVIALIYGSKGVPLPEFLTPAERASVERELKQLAAIGPAPDYLALEAVKWAGTAPADEHAAEALAHAVEGGRWSCDGVRHPELARRAFQTLHRLFPKSTWSARTKYWYE